MSPNPLDSKTKKIVLGLTGGIAIYKAAGILRRMVRDLQLDVSVIMTKSSQEFMSPLIFETFSQKQVYTDMFSGGMVATRHIELAQSAEVVLVCPATANILAKVAHGIADDLLSTVILAAGNKTVFAPAMNDHMYLNPITQENIRILKAQGYGFIEPKPGELACNSIGPGRLADEQTILDYLESFLNKEPRLKGRRVLVTAGPTREKIDLVRFISNRSSGKMGYALAMQARQEGADVCLISGPTGLSAPSGINVIQVETAQEMASAIQQQAESIEYLFMAAAVEDFVPTEPHMAKIKKSSNPGAIAIQLAPDIVKLFRDLNKTACIVGFSVESQDGKKRSLAKLRDKGLDYIVWNDPTRVGAGFQGDTNEVTLLSKDGQEWFLQLDSKKAIARQIIRIISEHQQRNA
jgi:phosphopantothenoylcysteine decarboxylase/phosphopantothenate--cysteine ligase